MRTVRDSAVLTQLVARLEALRPDTARRWGTMTPGEMLCHLGDATASVLGRPASAGAKSRPILKWIALRSPLPWPHGLKTPEQDQGTKEGDILQQLAIRDDCGLKGHVPLQLTIKMSF